MDPIDKKLYVWVSNFFGGWSQIKLISLFVDDHVGEKVRGKEPSAIFFDEAQTTESEAYFREIVQQLGRRQDIQKNEQFIIYAANPKGPSHWLYKRFFCYDHDEEGNPIEFPIDEETGHPIRPDGTPIKEYAVFHVPISENIHNLPDGYWENVLEAVKNDPIEYQRMIQGLWVDKPEGDSLFKDEWKDQLHLRGDFLKSVGLVPASGYPMVLSWDPGAAHTSVHFQQFIAVKDKIVWAVIDEKNCVGRYTPYRRLVPELIKRMQYWEGVASKAEGKEVKLRFIHISDSSAFNQFRAKEGSFDAQDIEDISREYVVTNNLEERFIIKMRACPKGPHSVEARVRIAKDLLVTESIVVSATCAATRAMFMHIEEDKDARMKPKRSKHIHSFDSLTYAHLYYNSGLGRAQVKAPAEPAVRQEFYSMGRS